MAQVRVIGAGVAGLVSALTLRESGHSVRVVAESFGEGTASMAAGAVWMPYLCNPPERVNRWSRETYSWYAELARTAPESGVDALTMFEATEGDRPPWWRDALPDGTPLDLVDSCPMRSGARAWRFPTYRADPRTCLPWLRERLLALGVELETGRVESLAVRDPGETVVNCTGLGARDLCDDPDLYATFGQVVDVRTGDWDPTVAAGDEIDGVSYMIPRRGNVVVIGGCALRHDGGGPAAPRAEVSESILARVDAWGAPRGEVVGSRAGLRPCRSAVRVERDARDARVIHNYGHGGAGWTMCRGCAREVEALVQA